MDLHTAVRNMVRHGETEASALTAMSMPERAAFQTWSRRVREAGNNAASLVPPGAAFEWIVAGRTETAS